MKGKRTGAVKASHTYHNNKCCCITVVCRGTWPSCPRWNVKLPTLVRFHQPLPTALCVFIRLPCCLSATRVRARNKQAVMSFRWKSAKVRGVKQSPARSGNLLLYNRVRRLETGPESVHVPLIGQVQVAPRPPHITTATYSKQLTPGEKAPQTDRQIVSPPRSLWMSART